jgi:hypothetical protein
VRDRVGEGSDRIRFWSAILPPYARRSKSLEALIPILYLKGVSTGDFEEALVALLGKDAGGLSATTIGRLKEAWSEEHARCPSWRSPTARLASGRRSRKCGRRPAAYHDHPDEPWMQQITRNPVPLRPKLENGRPAPPWRPPTR